MIDSLLRFFLHQRFIAVLLGVILIGVGIWSFNQLKMEAYPDISDTQTVIVALYPGHATEEVEQQVTVPIERALNNTPGVIARRSRTIFGLSVVELTFAYGTDDYFARQVVLERLRDAALPDGVTPDLAPLSTPVGELYRYYLAGESQDLLQLRELQDWVIDPKLLQVPGVADVPPFGGLVKQYQIEVDPMALYKYGLSINQIAQAVNANNQNAGGALLDNGQQAMVVRGVGLVGSTSDIENIVVAEFRGVPVYIKNVGRVKIGFAPQTTSDYSAHYGRHHLCLALLHFRFRQPRRARLAKRALLPVGGVVALHLRGMNLSVSAAVGFVLLFGVAVMSGVLIVAEINRRRAVFGVCIEEAIVQGALVQMRPVLMMVVVALLGMVPAATATGIGSDVQRPLATVVVGGLLSTLFLTLLALPSLNFLAARRGEKRSA